MQSFHDVVIAIVAFIVLIGVMVVVHEFGHFLVAKLCRVRVEQFSIGFPPRLFGIKIGETDYCVSALPLGGYVKMTGESMPGENMSLEGAAPDQIEAQKADPGALTSHPRWQRILIGLAGPAANFVLAFVLMVVYFGWINEVPKYVVNSTTVEWIVPGSAAAQAGLKTGDVIQRFDTVDNPDWMQVAAQSTLNLGQTVQLTVERAGVPTRLSLSIPNLPKGHDFDFPDVGILPQRNLGPINVVDVSPGTPAAQAGLEVGDEVETVNGLSFHFIETMIAYLQANPGKTVTLGVVRKGAHVAITATPEKVGTKWQLGFTSANPPLRYDPLPLGKAIAQSSKFCVNNSTLIVNVLGGLFTHKVAVSQLSGPVGIARMAGQAAQMDGYMPKFWTAAAISLNLGILNLLPFPILDGGMILFLLIEGAMQRDININVKERIYQAAFVVLVVFFVFIIFNDVTKLPIFMHVKQ